MSPLVTMPLTQEIRNSQNAAFCASAKKSLPHILRRTHSFCRCGLRDRESLKSGRMEKAITAGKIVLVAGWILSNVVGFYTGAQLGLAQAISECNSSDRSARIMCRSIKGTLYGICGGIIGGGLGPIVTAFTAYELYHEYYSGSTKRKDNPSSNR